MKTGGFLRVLTLGVTLLQLGGCAYLTTYTRDLRLDGQNSVAVDVKQRVIFSQIDPNAHRIVTCAEPSPDALTVIGSSLAGSFDLQTPSGPQQANLTAALSESGAFVGLRTPSIQVLRDAMYRLCEGYASGAINANEFESMQRRFQSTMMGLLAIEQLTKPVVAGQVVLMTKTDARAGANGEDAAVQAAQKRVDDQRDKVTAAQNAVDSRSADVRADQAAIREDLQKLSEAKDADAKAPIQADLKTQNDKLATDNQASKAAQHQLEQERQTLQDAQADLRAARSSAAVAASGSSQVSEIVRATTESSTALAGSVAAIVSEINQSYMRDGCLEFLSRVAYEERDGKVFRTPLKEVCADVLAEEAHRLERTQERRIEELKLRLLLAQTAKESPPVGQAAPPAVKKEKNPQGQNSSAHNSTQATRGKSRSNAKGGAASAIPGAPGAARAASGAVSAASGASSAGR